MVIEIWQSDWDTTVCIQGEEYPSTLWLYNAALVEKIEGEDWNDCMNKYHQLMQWEPYVPFNKDEFDR